jgi:hypothetical protein
MSNYEVTIYEVLAHTVKIEAEDKHEAVAQARLMVRDGSYEDQIAVESLGENDFEPYVIGDDDSHEWYEDKE